jgi:protein-disulfide isomerase
MPKSSFAKYLSIFLLGLILGYSVKSLGILNLSQSLTPSITENGSIKVMGKEDAPITITEYSDFQCPLCKKYFDDTFSTIVEQYVNTGKVKYVFKHFPLNIHPEATPASIASECALEQDKFWEMHDQLFMNQQQWSSQADHINTFKGYAKNMQLDEGKFNECLDNKTYSASVNADYEEGLKSNVRGTPTLYINDQPVIGAQPTANFTKIIDGILETEAAK